ncbi:LppP/LprE family lipoprotein [Rhodococcus sp. NPDC003322]
MKPTLAAVAGAALLLAAVAGCGDDVGSGTVTTHPVTTSPTATTIPAETSVEEASEQTAPPQPSAPPTTAPPAAASPISGNGLCLDPTSSGVTAALASLGPDDTSWIVDRADPAAIGNCPELLWLIATPAGATASTPEHVVFFHDGRFLGTATSEPYSYTSVAGSTADTVTVQYRWLGPGDANCCPSGGPATVDYRWDGGTVVMQQPLPQAMLDSYGR